ncbi:carboxymuconolactone decarboxylase family protein [Actinocrispum wychmicini]|uniref:AhpD family alkylhydroperoxidase n=1 Tax=Actinocrispum wychmicini TaxID=1213861 RepID=A0A4R2JZD1_9PSEU|nr:carboxymuconolactone decarboxylase family protein [Actinocrispum wychmicini]TCO62786.1 AhpD family alkylhydroperoxidase [Actinocrispum wychmicini]
MKARIAPGTFRQVGPVAWVIAVVGGRQARSGPLTLFLTLGRNRPLFRGWLQFARKLMPGGKLPRQDTELVILRVAHARRCGYEQRHHIRLGKRAGLTDDDIARIETDSADGWTPRQRAILAAVDQLLADHDIDDPTWALLRTHLDEEACIELCFLVGHYEMLATTITALRVQPDPPKRDRQFMAGR